MRTKNIILVLVAVCLVSAGLSCSRKPSPKETPPASPKEQAVEKTETQIMFDSVVDHLDVGGDALIYFNFSGMIKESVGQLKALIPPSAAQDVPFDPIEIFNRIDRFLENIGLYDAEAYGFSSMPINESNDRFQVKSFLKVKERDSTPLLWKIMGEPATVDALNYMGDDTVLMVGMRFNSDVLLALVMKGVVEIGGAEAAQTFDQTMAEMRRSAGIDPVSLLDMLGDEWMVGIQLSKTENIDIPVKSGESISIPKPSFLLAFKTQGKLLIDEVLEFGKKNGVKFEEITIEGATAYTLPPVTSAPFPLSICLFQHGDQFMIASDAGALKRALEVAKSGGGIMQSEEIKSVLKDMPAEYSSLTYLSKRYMRTVFDLQKQSMEMSGEQALTATMKEMYGIFSEGDIVEVGVVTPGGMYSVGQMPYGGRDVMKSVMIAPIGVMAAWALPSSIKARNASQKNMIINTLRQIDAAKEQCAIEKGMKEGDVISRQKVGEYIKGGFPTFPEGVRYEVNAIGEAPSAVMPNGVMITL